MTDGQNPGATEATADAVSDAAAAPAPSAMPVGNATLASEAHVDVSLPDSRQPGLQVPMRTTDLSCFFGKHKAVEDISLAFPEKTVTALIGPSGCGKSTFLRSLNRMHELVPGAYNTGNVLLHDQDVYAKDTDPVAVRRAVGMVFQRPNPFPTKSIAENLWAGPKFNRVKGGKAERDEVVERTLRGAGLWDEVKNRLNAPAGGLSGGQQQRLCIARALAVEPDVLLMDEPCSALDPQSTLRIEDLIRELKDRVTIVIVTHNMQQAARVSDYTAFITIENEGEPGRLIETGLTRDVFGNPTHPRTEAYVTGRFG